MATKNFEEALKRASFCLKQAGVVDSRVEAEILLSHLLKIDRLQLFLNRNRVISPQVEAAFKEAVFRRSRGEPLAYITGEKYFYGYRFMVNRNVLIPRPETELIIEGALKWADQIEAKYGEDISCIDLGTGSGILAVTLALKLPAAAIWAVDLSAAVLDTAKKNAETLTEKNKICFLEGNFFDALEHMQTKPSFNLIASNPPYIRQKDLAGLPREVKDFEPIEALNGGKDGLDSYRKILDGLSPYIREPALMLLEIGFGQKKQVEDLCLQTGLFSSIKWRYDLAGHPRILEGYIEREGSLV